MSDELPIPRLSDEMPLTPLQKEKRKVPEVVIRETRKFALEQAVKAAPHLIQGSLVVVIVDVASEFEDYILNGRKEEKRGN